MRLRMPLPRPMLLLSLGTLAMGVPGTYHAWWAYKNRSAFMDAQQYDGRTVSLMAGVWLVWLGVWLLVMSLTHDYSMWVWGETVTGRATVNSGDSVSIGPLLGLADKALLLTMRSDLPAELRPRVESFRLYRGLPLVPSFRYVVHLYGRSGGELVLITEQVLKRNVDPIGASSGEASVDADTIEMPVQRACENYLLKVRATLGRDDSARGRGFTPLETSLPFNVTVKLAVALRVRDVQRYKECSVRNARVQAL